MLEALNRIERRGAGDPLDPRDVCIELIHIGYFASDRGCMWAGTFVNGTFLTVEEGQAGEIARKGLAAAGWLEADANTRQELARAWLRVLYVYSGSLKLAEKAPQSWGEDAAGFYHAPRLEVKDDGTIEIVIWLQEPVGMQPGIDLRQDRVVFHDDGTVKRTTIQRKALP